ncbi:phytoene/squalene synthase family protein [Saccharomonospora piscinae]|uniref:phytoene/squalene synthase family protein n=1 Tax=Saccharomonospora piscinae TaxID=687388 RepID=UPI001105FFF4|nr:phytoene/squalene synthase family protein [Saccharomonospora piscinae]TLW94921.1 phytoene/squalene synthase family protein [Saccharomonospora piscinae]
MEHGEPTASPLTRRELTAAGISDPRLRAAYARCRRLNAAHGRTYFLATRLLPASRRPAVHALYGFARHADDIVDGDLTVAEATARLGAFDTAARQALADGDSDHPVLAALADTVRRYRIDPSLFSRFLRSMRMDLTTAEYPTRAALDEYVHGSAEVIGLQLLPVLGTVGEQAEAAPRAAALGSAFQLTNFLRDVAEDLDRGRVYLPADELAAHGVDRDLLEWCHRTGYADPRARAAIADQVERTRARYRVAWAGVAQLRPESRPCVATAFTLYSRILDVIAEAGYDVFAGRAVVAVPTRLALAARTVVRTWAASPRQAPPLRGTAGPAAGATEGWR